MNSNRWQLETMRGGIQAELKDATEKLSKMYSNPDSVMEDRKKQQAFVEDIKERLEGVNKQIEDYDTAAAKKLEKQRKSTQIEGDEVTVAKAALYRSAFTGEPVTTEHRKALKDDSSSGGDKFLPKTVASEILAKPADKNPLREDGSITNITNLELPKIAFELEDDDFIKDGETAKELKLDGSNVEFGRNKFKVKVKVSETILRGTHTNLVSVIDTGLESGLAKKEKKVAFAMVPKSGEEHMSFYQKRDDGEYAIKAVSAKDKHTAIMKAIADLEEDYRENAKVYMTYSDYIDILYALANGSRDLFGAPPEEVIGRPVRFCDYATIPVVGDFSYSHTNYDGDILYDSDKNVEDGMHIFVITAWFDHQVKMKSAFRLAVVGGTENP